MEPIRIKTTSEDREIVVDEYGKEIWVSMKLSGARAYCSLTVDQAQELIQALQDVLTYQEKESVA